MFFLIKLQLLNISQRNEESSRFCTALTLEMSDHLSADSHSCGTINPDWMRGPVRRASHPQLTDGTESRRRLSQINGTGLFTVQNVRTKEYSLSTGCRISHDHISLFHPVSPSGRPIRRQLGEPTGIGDTTTITNTTAQRRHTTIAAYRPGVLFPL